MEFKDFIKNTSLITGILIYLGFFELWIYYKIFNLNIIYYIDFSEIIVSFLGDILILILISIGLIYSYYMFNIKFNLQEELKNIEEKSKIKYSKRLVKILKGYSGTFIGIFIIGIMIFFLFKTNVLKWIGVVIILQNILYIPFDIIIQEIRIAYYNKHKELASTNIFVYIFEFIAILLMLSFFTLNEAQSVKNYYYYGTEVTINSNVMKSDSIEYFIGKTRNYIFFYNDTAKVARIFPMDDVKEIRLKTK